jgi:hypothetical protein
MVFHSEKYQKKLKIKIYVTISTHFCSIIDTDPYPTTKIVLDIEIGEFIGYSDYNNIEKKG